jgi:maltose O-acetyltransferase
MGAGVVIEDHAALVVAAGRGAPRLSLGDRVRVGRFATVHCAERVEIGDDVRIDAHAVITDSWCLPASEDASPAGSGAREVPPPPPGGPVVIGPGARIGPGAVVGPGVTVGEHAVVHPGAVVLDDVPPAAVADGNPATISSSAS